MYNVRDIVVAFFCALNSVSSCADFKKQNATYNDQVIIKFLNESLLSALILTVIS